MKIIPTLVIYSYYYPKESLIVYSSYSRKTQNINIDII